MTREISLTVNGQPIQLDYFVQGFIDHTTSGMMEALEGTGQIGRLKLTINGEEVKININDSWIPVNTFASMIIRSTMAGMLSPLKGVSAISKVELNLKK